ncbi:hypothetical protein C7S16_5144 [Burkholderia thailandensis]|uniref:Uncharacterized protein n=1 Tax=Burkholderia thailandensis TaxID=57975 RepID=A0AAW9CL95_BURTH|nr:hypothetical protein [Burkholderia thailandensis]MDW9251663.1 hypothetical protein [Burkholderia thailandensis]UCR75681.1 hypothetical protein BtTXDOH_32 [Burkholderia phage phiBt-TXDOH]
MGRTLAKREIFVYSETRNLRRNFVSSYIDFVCVWSGAAT